VFTPAAQRPEALRLCRRFVAKQTYPIHEHIIQRGGTLAENLIVGLPKVTGEAVVIFEDDDYYTRRWVEWCAGALERHQAAGDGHTHYYHLRTGGYRRGPARKNTASLCCTAFRTEQIPRLIEECYRNHLIDHRFWDSLNEAGVPVKIRQDATPMVVGIKGLPGTPGMGKGHRASHYASHSTIDNLQTRVILRLLVGEDLSRQYLELMP